MLHHYLFERCKRVPQLCAIDRPTEDDKVNRARRCFAMEGRGEIAQPRQSMLPPFRRRCSLGVDSCCITISEEPADTRVEVDSYGLMGEDLTKASVPL